MERIGFVDARLRSLHVFEFIHENQRGLRRSFPYAYPNGIITLLVFCDYYRRFQRRRKRRAGICTKCGYDLRATPSRCPQMRNGVIKPKRINRWLDNLGNDTILECVAQR